MKKDIDRHIQGLRGAEPKALLTAQHYISNKGRATQLQWSGCSPPLWKHLLPFLLDMCHFHHHAANTDWVPEHWGGSSVPGTRVLQLEQGAASPAPQQHSSMTLRVPFSQRLKAWPSPGWSLHSFPSRLDQPELCRLWKQLIRIVLPICCGPLNLI